MLIIDRYIVSKYVKSLIWAIVTAIVVFLVVDTVERLDNFIDRGVPASTVIRYYWLYIPYIVYLTLPVATLLATLFTIGGLTTTNELTAMYTSGISFTRPLMLLLVTAALSAAGIFYLSETIIPQSNRERMDIERYELKKIPRESRSKMGKMYLQLNTRQQLYINRYNPLTREAFEVELVEADSGRLKHRVTAEKMVWRNEKWLVQGAVERKFGDNGQLSWLRNDTLTVSGGGVRPDELEKIQTAPEEMNWKELREFIRRLKLSGANTLKWEVEMYSKVAMPTAAVIIVMFGAPIAAIKRRGGTALGFALALFISFIYFGFIQVGKVLGYHGTLTPITATWIGNVFFGILGLVVLARKRV